MRMSKYQDRLKELAMEEDSAKRLEIASEIDVDADDLEANWGNRDEATRLEGELKTRTQERDEARAETSEWKTRYADKFFDYGTTPAQINQGMKKDIQQESRPQSYADLWKQRG